LTRHFYSSYATDFCLFFCGLSNCPSFFLYIEVERLNEESGLHYRETKLTEKALRQEFNQLLEDNLSKEKALKRETEAVNHQLSVAIKALEVMRHEKEVTDDRVKMNRLSLAEALAAKESDLEAMMHQLKMTEDTSEATYYYHERRLGQKCNYVELTTARYPARAGTLLFFSTGVHILFFTVVNATRVFNKFNATRTRTSRSKVEQFW
jgi:hypothetical protein